MRKSPKKPKPEVKWIIKFCRMLPNLKGGQHAPLIFSTRSEIYVDVLYMGVSIRRNVSTPCVFFKPDWGGSVWSGISNRGQLHQL